MQMVSQAEAFGGRWTASPLAWFILLLPVTLLVVIQEATTPFPSAAFIFGSALAQHAIAGGISMGIVAILRIRRPVLPIVVAASLWGFAAVLRGVVGGLFAALFAGVDPEYVFRIAYWVVATAVWAPLLTYVFAQIDVRRKLHTELALVIERVQVERERAHRSAAKLTTELVASVREAVGPLVADVRSRLALAAAQDQEIPLGPISERLEFIANEARAIIEHPENFERHGAAGAPPPSSPLRESLTFDRSRPLFASTLTVVALAAVILPESVHSGGIREAAEAVVALLAGGTAMVVGLLVAGRRTAFTAGRAALVFVIAGLTAVAALIAVDQYPLTAHDLSLLFALPSGFVVSAAALAAALGLGTDNLNVLETLNERQKELDELHEHSRAREERIAAQVNEILHGPILGRLSACVMALNFFLAEPDQTRGLRRNATTEGVLAHLKLITQDLEKLTNAQGRSTRTL